MSGGFTPSLKRSDVEISGEAHFLASEHYQVKRSGITLDASVVDADSDGNKIIERGTFVTPITASGKYGPYLLTSEQQTITIAAGVSAFTLTFSGKTTESIDDEATAAQIQAALEALENVGEGNVVVAGEVDGPFTVDFVGALANTDVAQMTGTGTGGDVTIATVTAGGAAAVSDGRETPDENVSGYLLESVNLRDGDVVTGLLIHGSVLAARVTPSPVPDAIRTACAGRITFQ